MDTQFDFYNEERKFSAAEVAFEEINDKYDKLLTSLGDFEIRKLEIIYLYKKFITVRDMTPKGFGPREEEIRKEKLEQLKVMLMNKIANCFEEDIGFNFSSFVENLIEEEKMNPASSYNLVERYKNELSLVCQNYLGDVKVILPIPGLEKIHYAKHRENQYYNEIVDAIFATSSYDGILKYIMRANVGGMRVRGGRVDLPGNPFDLEHIDENNLYLKDMVSIYSLDAREFEPVVDFFVSDGDPTLVFDYEWISRKEKLMAKEQKVNCIPRSFFENNSVFTHDVDPPMYINEFIRKSISK